MPNAEDEFEKDKMEEEFNKVLSTTKENGGLLASLGLSKKDTDEIRDSEEDRQEPKKSEMKSKSG